MQNARMIIVTIFDFVGSGKKCLIQKRRRNLIQSAFCALALFYVQSTPVEGWIVNLARFQSKVESITALTYQYADASTRSSHVFLSKTTSEGSDSKELDKFGKPRSAEANFHNVGGDKHRKLTKLSNVSSPNNFSPIQKDDVGDTKPGKLPTKKKGGERKVTRVDNDGPIRHSFSRKEGEDVRSSKQTFVSKIEADNVSMKSNVSRRRYEGKSVNIISTSSKYNKKAGTKTEIPQNSFSSLLPPPLTSVHETNNSTHGSGGKNPLMSGLSSWEEFLGANRTSNRRRDAQKSSTAAKGKVSLPVPQGPKAAQNPEGNLKSRKNYLSRKESAMVADFSVRNATVNHTKREIFDEEESNLSTLLPSIQDLFPLDLPGTKDSIVRMNASGVVNEKTTLVNDKRPKATIISESTRSKSTFEEKIFVSQVLDGIPPVSDLFYRSSQSQNQEVEGDDEHDDEELPFSAEQSDAVFSDENKIVIRQNMIQNPNLLQAGNKAALRDRQKDDGTSSKYTSAPITRSRKMVRRGMEMLVGGVPINADPPQRSLELYYDAQQCFEADNQYSDWASAISVSTRDFGPMLYRPSLARMSQFERGIFCEHFCQSAMKWGVCPQDLKKIVQTFTLNNVKTKMAKHSSEGLSENGELIEREENVSSSVCPPNMPDVLSEPYKNYILRKIQNETNSSQNFSLDKILQTKGYFSFQIGVGKEELQTGEVGYDESIVEGLCSKALLYIMKKVVVTSHAEGTEEVMVDIFNHTLSETEGGYTSICVTFGLNVSFPTNSIETAQIMKRVAASFSKELKDGAITLAFAAAAKNDTRWPSAIRERVIEECLFQEDIGDESTVESEIIGETGQDSDGEETSDKNIASIENDSDVSFGTFLDLKDDEAFFDPSDSNSFNSPFEGKLGLRLVDAVVERAKQRQPKVIAVGDVHGCIDELQDLLRQCDYGPGDLVILLGDLVCKGPDSTAVVQMAREIGAIGVRGNHDFEVIRWHQAILSGVDPPVVGSEHFHIASSLTKADMHWMYNLPWFISSKDLGCLFVHAGFVSGIRLAKQNPRLMMNMRSILPDGTVTSKFFNNWPWARLWDGPQTVLFGHDADRGLQQYEHALGLDTGCVYGGRLTACILPERRLVSVSARREYFKYRRKHYD